MFNLSGVETLLKIDESIKYVPCGTFEKVAESMLNLNSILTFISSTRDGVLWQRLNFRFESNIKLRTNYIAVELIIYLSKLVLFIRAWPTCKSLRAGPVGRCCFPSGLDNYFIIKAFPIGLLKITRRGGGMPRERNVPIPSRLVYYY